MSFYRVEYVFMYIIICLIYYKKTTQFQGMRYFCINHEKVSSFHSVLLIRTCCPFYFSKAPIISFTDEHP